MYIDLCTFIPGGGYELTIYKNRATALKKHICGNFVEEDIYKKFVDIVIEGQNIITATEVDEMYTKLFQ